MRTDVFLVPSFLLSVSAFLLQPSGALAAEPLFKKPVSYVSADNPQKVITQDFNEDGHVDLAITNTDTDSVSIYLGAGDGTFAAAVYYTVGDNPISVAAGDFNEDGHVDLAVTNEESDNISILIGAGDGTFAAASNFSANIWPFSLVTGDFNEDMHEDLAVTNYFSDSLSVLLGMGDGTFNGAVSHYAGSFAYSLVAGDFDEDGHTDLAITNAATDEVSVLLGEGNGTFTFHFAYPAGSTPTSITAGDIDGDGELDLAITNSAENEIGIMIGNGLYFRPYDNYMGAFDLPISITIGDLDMDGHGDLVVSNFASDMITVLNGRGDGRLDLAYGLSDVGDGPSSGALGDFDEDGDVDVATANSLSADVSILLSNMTCNINTITDIPNDQGKQVSITWDKCYHDHGTTHITLMEYAVYRRIDYDLSSSNKSPSYPPGDWHYITSVPARAEQEYSVVVPTLADSTILEGMYYSTFFISGLSSTPGSYYDSVPDSGYSVDNLAPGAPAGFAVAYNAGSGNDLSWEECGDEDFRYYNIYRSEDDGFDPGAGNLVRSTADIHWLDTVEDGWKYHYKITSLDFSGNESDPSAPDETTGTDVPGVPASFSLCQNYPNPFNPVTTIRFDLPADTEVTLSVYNVQGEKIRTLVDRRMKKGQKSVDWDGRMDDGKSVVSGVYLYRISAGRFKETRKMILLR